MTIRVSAVYENGVLRLKDALTLPEGTAVQVIISDESRTVDGNNPAKVLADIAELPMEPGGQEFSGRDHDRVLYGDQDKP